jgi:hypothetical protein
MHVFSGDFSDSLLWADPAFDVRAFGPSKRGVGCVFGNTALQNFLTNNDLKCLVRGHECVMSGVQSLFNQQLFTVFSASNYCGTSQNEAGILIVFPDLQMQIVRYAPLPFLKRVLPKRERRRLNSSASMKTVAFSLDGLLAGVPKSTEGKATVRKQSSLVGPLLRVRKATPPPKVIEPM